MGKHFKGHLGPRTVHSRRTSVGSGDQRDNSIAALRHSRGAKGIYKVKALSLKRSDIFAEQRKHQSLVGFYHAQPYKRKPPYCKPYYTHNKHCKISRVLFRIKPYCRRNGQSKRSEI